MIAETRELLELAAKACGVDVLWTQEYGGLFLYGMPCTRIWNPRDDDGDCARMEAALGLDVRWSCNSVAVHWTRTPGDIVWTASGKEQFHRTATVEQRSSARRIASVRAAAAIGRAMP